MIEHLTLDEKRRHLLDDDVDPCFPPGDPRRLPTGIYDRRHKRGCIYRYNEAVKGIKINCECPVFLATITSHQPEETK